MPQARNLFLWIFASLFLGITSCSIETAQPEKYQALVVASDFLQEEDTVLFSKFTQENDLHIIIRNLSVDRIISEIQSKGYNSRIDVILSQNMQTPITLNKHGILQDIVRDEEDTKTHNQFISYKHNFVGIGLDPFVFKYTHDSISEPRRYKDLIDHHHYHTLSKSDLMSFLSPIRKERNRAQTYEWAKRWNEKSTFRPEHPATIDSAELVLCKYSQLTAFEDSIWQGYSEGHYFPNQDKSGVYFDLMTVATVQQAEHYADAQKLIKFCQNPGFNAFLANKMNHFPIYDYLSERKTGPKFYSTPIDQLLQSHDVLARMLDKLN